MIDLRDGPTRRLCPNSVVKVNDLTVTAHATCRIGRSDETVHTTITFTDDRAFHRVTRATYVPPYVGRMIAAMTQDGRWRGPCPAGMRPGDVIGPNGVRVNMAPRGRAGH